MKTILVAHAGPDANPLRRDTMLFQRHFGRLLKTAGHDVSILLTCRPSESIEQSWRAALEQSGPEVVSVALPAEEWMTWVPLWSIRVAEAVTPYLQKADGSISRIGGTLLSILFVADVSIQTSIRRV
jgi:hypothetical protein